MIKADQSLAFREAMAQFSAAVTVVATDGDAGRRGITATAVCSVTDTPPTLLVCINETSEINALLKDNKRLSVNILNHSQEDTAKHFAGFTELSMEERFSESSWYSGHLNQPILEGALANLEGFISDIQKMGSHFIYFAQIEAITLGQDDHGLVYFRRNFNRITHTQADTE